MIYLKTKKYHSIFYFKLSYVSIEKYLSKKILSSKSLKIFDLFLGSIKNLQLTLNYNLIIKRTIIKNAYSPSRKLVTEKYQRIKNINPQSFFYHKLSTSMENTVGNELQ